MRRTVYKEKKLLVYWEKIQKKKLWKWIQTTSRWQLVVRRGGGGERVQAAGSDDGMHAFVGVCGACVTVVYIYIFTDVFIIIT